ncbi:Clavaminate synthase-like protein [Byssothecium circinans]|uniref:Clavaminate synthase-like protein n=1 Tax=Byssothecium circinans TaxID=147558 RepID=A0A6A5TR47_9PLEO|nr:Clavaminate synthase-like protein [Byssothecium circinans]
MAIQQINGIAATDKVASLQTINFAKVLDDNDAETQKMIAACEHYGFFYLDLNQDGGREMLKNLEYLRSVMFDWFNQSLPTKMETITHSYAHGYKPTGIQSGITTNSKDGFEALKVGRDELKGAWALPPIVKANRQTLSDFSDASHFVLKTLLDRLSSGLGLTGDKSLHKYAREGEPSKSTLYFLHYPAAALQHEGVGQNMHTDIGLLTLLFAPQWGLQAMSPDNGEWEWVEPKAGYAIINVGDSLRFLSGKKFRSALHRAVPAEGVDRAAISYFLRASDSTSFVDSDESSTDARAWFLKKYDVYEQPHEVQKKDTTLSGGMAQEIALVKSVA